MANWIYRPVILDRERYSTVVTQDRDSGHIQTVLLVVGSRQILVGVGRLWSSLANLLRKRPTIGATMTHLRLRGAFLIALFASALFFSCQSDDTQKKLDIYGSVHVYRSMTPPSYYPGSDFIAVIGPTDKVKIRQVVQKANYVAIKVVLPDGKEGWVFSGESIELYEPHCRGPDFRAC